MKAKMFKLPTAKAVKYISCNCFAYETQIYEFYRNDNIEWICKRNKLFKLDVWPRFKHGKKT